MRPRVFPAEDMVGGEAIHVAIAASMRPRVFPAEDAPRGRTPLRIWYCFNEAAGIPRGRRTMHSAPCMHDGTPLQ